MAMARFEFDPAAHRYTLDGRELPSVTQILRGLDDFSNVPARVLEKARDRGSRVHAACNLDVLGILDENTVDDEVAPYLAQFRKFLRESGFTPTLTECRVYDERLWYAGTLDLFGDLPGCIDVQIDIKSGAIPRSVGPQTAAYSNGLYKRAGIMTRKRFVLKLEAGKYSLIQLDRADDFGAFCHALQRFNEGEK
jgi:hypothetical protein